MKKTATPNAYSLCSNLIDMFVSAAAVLSILSGPVD
jgi:hypothetical protein